MENIAVSEINGEVHVFLKGVVLVIKDMEKEARVYAYDRVEGTPNRYYLRNGHVLGSTALVYEKK
jgi:hypothetical protein